ncbi:putative GTP-binding protein 6 [Microplitis mediator]|uniref:putative GTP-binding protein 6 n=1 Tax=Microplitis mediator TaxID=375433 RepID=UPI0025553508|nr:putative GTP-binding protein 6 [Microplitis mediator]
MHLLKNIKQTSKFILLNYKKILNHNSKLNSICIKRFIHDYEHESIDEDPTINREYADLTKQYLNPAQHGHGTLILQPYIKWGADKKRNTTPQLQLAEAEALIRTLPRWTVVDSLCISLMTLKKKKLLGKGNLKMLEERVKHDSKVTALFVSVNLLRPVQINELQDLLGVPVYDRYSIVIQIFREHAKTPEAKLQVALAELPYIWKKLTWTTEDSGGRINLSEKRKLVLHARESKLRNALSKLKEHRKLIRSNRSSKKIPSVAIVGYTNSGKTCLIKALTGDQSLMPQNKLFATLDTTAHEGLLPCRLKVLYMDTIGFIQDIPEGLIEPFVATFEDAIIADVIVHVYDASHPDKDAQIEHVRETLDKIMTELETPDKPIIEIANKCDVAPTGAVPDNVLAISALKLTGIDLLRRQIEKHILDVTGRKSLKIRVLSGSNIAAWLYKETTVTDTEADLNNPQYMFITSLVTDQQMHRFKKFIKEQSAR